MLNQLTLEKKKSEFLVFADFRVYILSPWPTSSIDIGTDDCTSRKRCALPRSHNSAPAACQTTAMSTLGTAL